MFSWNLLQSFGSPSSWAKSCSFQSCQINRPCVIVVVFCRLSDWTYGLSLCQSCSSCLSALICSVFTSTFNTCSNWTGKSCITDWVGSLHSRGHLLSSPVDRLVGLVVKAFTSRAEDPGFESCLWWDFLGVESYQWLKDWHSSGYPAKCLALWGQCWDWLARWQYTVTGWDGELDLQLLSLCGST